MKKQIQHHDLPEPNAEEIEKNVRIFENHERYGSTVEDALNNLDQNYPGHYDLGQIWIKVAAINDIYATGIRDTFAMAKHINNINPAELIEEGNSKAVEKIASEHGIGNSGSRKEPRFYSFATKYCSYHRPETFPIC